MIEAMKHDSKHPNSETDHERFLRLLPQIRQQATIAFRNLRTEAREELVQEVIANAFRTWRRLIQQGKEAVAYATPLAQYAIRQVRSGRQIGSPQNAQDILSPQARRVHGISIERISRRCPNSGVWDALLVEDRKAGPAQTATARIDLHQWLGNLSERNRRIARDLALGESTEAVAQKFKLSAGRVSQLRHWFRIQWEQFQGGEALMGC